MPVLDLDGLTRYDGNIKDYIGRFANWQKSEKAGAVAIYPVPETTLEPTVDFMFTETPPASGDKRPENPSTIAGVSSVKVTRCGKNLLYYPYYLSTYSANGLTFTANADGTVLINGTANLNTYFSICDAPTGDQYASDYIRLVRDKNYICSLRSVAGTCSGDIYFQAMKAGSVFSCLYPALKLGSQSRLYWNNANAAEYMKYRLQVMNGAVCTNLVVAPQLEEGTEATAYESPANTTYTLPLGSTYYGGSIDLSTGLMTVTWWGESLPTPSSADLLPNDVRANGFLTKAHTGNKGTIEDSTMISNYGDNVVYPRYSAGSRNYSILLPYSVLGIDGQTATSETALAAVVSFLSEHPCFVAYKLYTPFTVQLTPTEILSLTQADKYTPRLNTIYTDAQTVQVGYVKSPIRSEYEMTQAIIATEGGE